MKCDELTPIDLECNMGKDINGVVHREPLKAYDIDEVDAAIAELKSENKMLKERIANGDVSRITWIDEAKELKAENEKLKAKLHDVDNQWNEQCKEIAQLKQKLKDVNELIKTARQMLEDAKASHYTEMVDAGMRERRLRRALYIAHEYKAKYKRWWLHLALDCEAREIHPDKKNINRIMVKIGNCEKFERKCLKKAEEYR